MADFGGCVDVGDGEPDVVVSVVVVVDPAIDGLDVHLLG